jgi:hypothetical protein
MKHLINREEYIKEYLRISNNIENENELYEGLLSTVFGGLKMLFQKDWENIKCKNPTVLKFLKSIDKSLAGYTMTKMRFSAECQNIRQNVADYFSDILQYKLSQIEKVENADEFIEKENKEREENKEAKGVEKILNIKDKTLLDSLKKYTENIKTNSSKSPKLKEYADQMLNAVIVTVNDIILKELEKKGVDKAKLEEERKKLEEEKKHLEEVRKKMDELAKKAGEKALKELNDERDNAMRAIGVEPIGAMDGTKSIEMITKQYEDMMKEMKKFNNLEESVSKLPNGYSDVFNSDTYIGLKKTFEERLEDGSNPNEIYNKFIINVILIKINTVFKIILKNKEMFKGVPSASVQAMIVSLINVIIYGFIGDTGESIKFNIENDKNIISLMTKCAIDSDATIGFNLPLIDPKKPDNGNFFVSIMNQFKNTDISSKEVEDVLNSMSGEMSDEDKDNIDISKLMKDFRQNISTLFDIIVEEAEKLKNKAEKEREEEAAKLEAKKEK